MKFALIGTCGIKLEDIAWWDFRPAATHLSKPVLTVFFRSTEPATFQNNEALKLYKYLLTNSKPLPNLIGSSVNTLPTELKDGKEPIGWVNGQPIYSERDPVAEELEGNDG